MNTKARVSALETRMAKLNGDSLPLLLMMLDGESTDEALLRIGMNEPTQRPIVWLSEDDVNL
jgi:hypothetical protein